MEESSKKNKMNNLSNKANLKMFEEIIKYNFNDKSLLTKSLTHTSASTEKVSSMERLEFLGDRILGLVISEELFLKYPGCLLYTSPSPRDKRQSRMPSSA